MAIEREFRRYQRYGIFYVIFVAENYCMATDSSRMIPFKEYRERKMPA